MEGMFGGQISGNGGQTVVVAEREVDVVTGGIDFVDGKMVDGFWLDGSRVVRSGWMNDKVEGEVEVVV